MTTHVNLFRLAQRRNDTAGQGVPFDRHLLRRYVLPAVLLFGFLGLASWASVSFLSLSHVIAVVSPHIPQSKVSRDRTPVFEAVGWIEPCPTPIRVTALVTGVVDRLLVVEDQAVTAGEVVAELVKDDARHIVELAFCDLKVREAELDEAWAILTASTVRLEQPVHLELPVLQTEAALATLETQLKAIPFEIRGAEARLDFATQNYQRKSALKGVVAGRTIDQTRSEFMEATASLEEHHARRASLGKEREALCVYRDTLKTQLELKVREIQAKQEAEARFKAAQARVKQAETYLAEARLRLDRMAVRAPMDGRISVSLFKLGRS